MSTQTIPDDLHLGYIVDLRRVTLDEEGNTSWIQAFPYGEWSHPEYGKIKMDAERAARMAAGINSRIRDQDLPINYDHGEQRKDAAGWVQRADVRPDGLWLAVEWTREAYQKIKDKAYKYFSPEYMHAWKHPASGQVFKDVFVGGALVNMPHLKGILPLNLSEYFTACADEIEEDLSKLDTDELKEMTRKSINDLPDSAFAYIEPGGKKDAEGKTTPRSLRHFPIHDEAHVRNALARLSQSPFGPKAAGKVRAAARRMGIKVAASESFRPTLEFVATLYDIEFTEATKDVELRDAIAAMIANIKKQRSKKKKTKRTYEEPGSVIIDLLEENWDQFDLVQDG